MLAYILALAIALGSFSLYMAAFFFPEVHRKYDFTWSGVGFFYALVLWVCAGRITGGVLLGQTASVALIGWFGWQTLNLRRELTPLGQQTQLPESVNSFGEVTQNIGKQLQTSLQTGFRKLPLPKGVEKLPDQVVNGFKASQNWLEGMWNTTFKPKPKRKPPIPPTPSSPLDPASETPVDFEAGILTEESDRPPED